MKNTTSNFMILDIIEAGIIGQDYNIQILQNKEAESFVKGEHTHCSHEYFVKIHGVKPKSKNFLQQLFNQSPEFYLSSTNYQVPAHKLISNIIKNNSTTEAVPVVHLLSCFSGSAQDHLNKVSGDVILCTYTNPNKTYIGGFDSAFIKTRSSHNSLTNHILDNFYILASVGFAISVKIGSKIFSYKTNSSIFTTDENLQNLIPLLDKQQREFQQFTHNVKEGLEKNHLENSTQVIPLVPADFKCNKLSVSVNLALIVAVANDDSIDNIKKLLNKTEIVPSTAFGIALEKNLEALKLFLAFDPKQVTKYYISRAITYNFDVLAMLLKCNASDIHEYHLRTAIEKYKPDELQLLLKYAQENSKNFDVSSLCQLTTDPAMLSILKATPLNSQLTQAVASTGEFPDGLSVEVPLHQSSSQEITLLHNGIKALQLS